MNRRSFLGIAGTAVSALLAGCTEQFTGGSDDDAGTDDGDSGGPSDGSDGSDGNATPDESGDSGNRTPENSDGSGSDQDDQDGQDEPEAGESGGEDGTDDEASDVDVDLTSPEAAIETYIEAAGAENEDILADVLHSEAPLQPDNWEDIEVDFGPFDAVDPDDIETEVVTSDAPGDDIRELKGADFWFQDVDFEETFADEDVRLVRLETGDPEVDRQFDTWVLVTDGAEWRVFFMGTEDTTLEDPTELFEEPIEDSDNDVVADVEWGVDPPTDDFGDDASFVEVTFTDDPGIEAHTVRIETTIAGGNLELYNDENDSMEVTWADSGGTIEFDPEGDQLEVIAVTDDGEEVVHREHYEP